MVVYFVLLLCCKHLKVYIFSNFDRAVVNKLAVSEDVSIKGAVKLVNFDKF